VASEIRFSSIRYLPGPLQLREYAVFAARLRELQRPAGKDLIHMRKLPSDLDTPIAGNTSSDLIERRTANLKHSFRAVNDPHSKGPKVASRTVTSDGWVIR